MGAQSHQGPREGVLDEGEVLNGRPSLNSIISQLIQVQLSTKVSSRRSFFKLWKYNQKKHPTVNLWPSARAHTRACTQLCATSGAHPTSYPILCCLLASFLASNLVTFLHKVIALQVSSSAKKEAKQLEFIEEPKSVIYASLSRFDAKLLGLDF